MYRYMEACRQKLESQLRNSEATPSNMQDSDITDEFQKALEASHGEAIAQKEKLREVTNSSLKEIENKLNALFEKVKGNTSSTETSFKDIASLATSYCNMGIVYMDVTSKPKLEIGRSHLHKCFELLRGNELDRRAILLIMRASVQLEHIFHHLEEKEKCCSFSHKAIGFYLEYTSQGREFPAPIVSRLSVSLDIEEVRSSTMLSLVTLYSELLPHIKKCEIDKWDLETLVKPVHTFFMNQWIEALADPLYEGVSWVNAAVDFVYYFITHFRFTDAKNYLVCIVQVVFEFTEKIRNYSSADNRTSIHMFMILYAATCSLFDIRVLRFSKHNFFNKNVKTRRENKSQSEASIMSALSTELIFPNEEEDASQCVGDLQVSVSNLDDAERVYNRALEEIEVCKKAPLAHNFYLIGTEHTVDLHKCITFFQVDKGKLARNHREHIKVLTDIKTRVSDTLGDIDSEAEHVTYAHYNKILRNCNLGLILTYGTLLDMILEDAEITEKRFEDIDTEVRNYVENSAECCAEFVGQLDIESKREKRE